MAAAYGDYADAVARAEERTRRLRDAARDGTYARQARQMADLNRQYDRMARYQDQIARYGRVGGWVGNRLGGSGAALGGALGMVGVSVPGARSLVSRGLSGTVEEHRFPTELTLLGRELAGAFKPVIDAATKLTKSFRQLLETLGPRGQNALMLGGMAVGGYRAYRAAGAAGGALFGGGAAAAAATAARAGGGLASRAAAAGKWVGKWSVPLALGAGAVEELFDGDGFFEMRRREGGSRFGSAMRSGWDIVRNLNPFEDYADDLRRAGRLGGKTRDEATRRAVTLAGGGFEEVGGGYDRLSAAASLLDRSLDGGGGGLAGAIRDGFKAGFDKLAALLAEKDLAKRPAGGM